MTSQPKKSRKTVSSQQKLIEELRQYIRTDGKQHLKDNNITSIGIGYKITEGKTTDQLCLQFTVREKKEAGVGLEALDTQFIPETITVAGEAIPTDVIQRDFSPAYRIAVAEETDVRKLRVDPLMPGISVSHPAGTAGTLGLIVYDRQTGVPCMLSNWHVLHQDEGQIGDHALQPGPYDDNNTSRNRVGALLRSHLGEAGDCAIATIEDRGYTEKILDLKVHPTEIVRVDLGDRVIKSGRTTKVTHGVVRRIDVISRISYNGVGPVDIGGFEIGTEPDAPTSYEVSMGGDSGSAWLIANQNRKATRMLAGLHFAGETGTNPDEHALACYAHSVFKKLDISLHEIPEADEELVADGYDVNFLSQEVPVPGLNTSLSRDAYRQNGSTLIDYTHFSVCLSKSRGFARFVAWNIDGSRLRKVNRTGFQRDPDIPSRYQHGNELYKHNPLDRGHIARRADLAWGPEIAAKQANKDSFYYTNIAPQHEAFNQSSKAGLWGELENEIFSEVRVEDLKISVMAGPLFSDDDKEYRDVRIPQQFWKLIAYKDTEDNAFKVRAYILTQRDLLNDLEVLELDPFRLFQVSLTALAQETDLDFSVLADFDTIPESIGVEEIASGQVREVSSREELLG